MKAGTFRDSVFAAVIAMGGGSADAEFAGRALAAPPEPQPLTVRPTSINAKK
jgi:hypothetical protein